MGRDDDNKDDSRNRRRGDDNRRDRESRDRERQKDRRRGAEERDREDRLLRKAKEFIEQQQQESSSRHRSDDRKEHHGRRHHHRDGDDKKHRKQSRRRDDHHHHGRHDDHERRHRRHKKSRHDRDDSSERHSRRKRHRRSRSRSEDRSYEKKKKEKKKEHKRKEDSKKTRVDKSKLADMGRVRGSPPSKFLDADNDYYAFHQHFLVYLFREEGKAFSALPSTRDARKAFTRFCHAYNAGKLEEAYYEPLPPVAAMEESTQQQHSWSFSTSAGEDRNLHALQEGIRKQTEYQAPGTTNDNTTSNVASIMPASKGDSLPNKPVDHRRDPPKDRVAERAANRRLRDHVRVVHEELTGGRKEGRERQIEKRKELANKIHGAAKSKDGDSMMELTDDALYGEQDKSSFQQALQRQKARSSRRDEQRKSRLEELQQKEKDKQDAMFKMLGIEPGQKKRTIAPRKD